MTDIAPHVMRLHSRSDRSALFASAFVGVLLSAVVLACGGCAAVGWFAHGVAGGKKTVTIEAQYLGLQGKKVAVMVAADQFTLFEYPNAPLDVCRAVTANIAAHVPNVTMVSPDEMVKFQRANPYWIAVPYSDLLKKLDVDRIILIDLTEFRTHEPGNAHVWQGLISADVNVYGTNASDPDNPVFATAVQARYPEDTTLGLVEGSDETVELGMLTLFAQKAAGLFYTHKVQQ